MMELDDHFKTFAGVLENAIQQTQLDQDVDRTTADLNRTQMERLVELEAEFRQVLSRHRWGNGVYRAFVHHILEERHNVLAARPFFRERQDVFTQSISPALKTCDVKALRRFNFNFNFIRFVVRCRRWHAGSPIMTMAQQHAEIRNRIVTRNMPLAISRARIFFGRTPPSHLSYMDLVQIGCEGLMAAVDKFCLPFSSVFGAVIVGRISGNQIDCYSETPLHFFPKDKRKLYRANKIVGRQTGAVDYEQLAQQVNEAVDSTHRTDASELADLMAAASVVSSDTMDDDMGMNGGVGRTLLSKCAAPDSWRPDVECETKEAYGALAQSLQSLSLRETKALRLRGIQM